MLLEDMREVEAEGLEVLAAAAPWPFTGRGEEDEVGWLGQGRKQMQVQVQRGCDSWQNTTSLAGRGRQSCM